MQHFLEFEALLVRKQALDSLLAVYQEIEDLVNIGAYVAGINPEFDLAVQARPKIVQFLQQEPNAPSTLEQAKKAVSELVTWVEQMDKLIRTQAAAKTQQRGGAPVAVKQ